MPEGDSLRHAEARLAPILEGQVATEVWFRKLKGYRPRAGQRIERVDAVGKHLLIEFDRGLTLDTHLGMAGSWRAMPPGPRPADHPRMRVLISTALGHALCYSAPVIATFVRGTDPSPVERLGPDLSDDDVEIDVCVARSRTLAPATPIADVLLDQRVAAGVGNVFKSETLFVVGVHPFTPLGEVDDATLHRLWSVAHGQLVANRGRPSRSTVGTGDRGRTFVYGRHRLGCRRCDNAIDFSAAGERSTRSTYWCPTCQPP